MARKTKEETLATRDGILDAAEACFQESGIANTSLEKIAARAGFTRGAVYWHFKNKGEILAAVITRCRVPFLQKLERASSDRPVPVSRSTKTMASTSSGAAQAGPAPQVHCATPYT